MVFQFLTSFYAIGSVSFKYISSTTVRIWLYVIVMSRTSFRVNPHPIVCLNVKELLARSRHYIWSLNDSNVIRTHNHLFCKRTLNHLAKLVSQMIEPLLLLKQQIWHLLRARRSLTFRQTIEFGFTLKLVRDMIITYR